MNHFMDLISQRYSCRRYASRPLEREKVEACLEAARLAPSACNSQPWFFAVATDPDIVRKVGATTQQFGLNGFADQVPVFVTVWEDHAKLLPCVAEHSDSQVYAQGDVGIATAYFTLAATELGLGTCIMGVFVEDTIRELLHVPQEKRLRYVVAVGYPENQHTGQPKGRKPLEAISQF